MKYSITKIIFYLSFLSVTVLEAQTISVSGFAYDKEYPQISLQQLMIINLNTQQGFFGNSDNSFTIQLDKNDTIVITAVGYSPSKFSLKDSSLHASFKVIIPMHRLSVQLNEVTIRRQRELQQINNDIKKLGYEKKDYQLIGIEAWSSPITAMYEVFSKKERNKRKLAEMINRDNRNSLIKELLDIYQRADLIELPREKYDDFITFLRLDDVTLQNVTDYDLAFYIRNRYIEFVER